MTSIVVVVDDDADAADSLTSLLRQCGYIVHTAYGGREAVELISRVVPDAVVSDIDMPQVSGIEEAMEVRAFANFRQPRMVAVSGAASSELERSARQAGFDAFLAKPASLASLLRELEAIA